MEDNTGDREDSGQEYSVSVSGLERVADRLLSGLDIIFGWCTECRCDLKYHVGQDSDGSCLYCGCKERIPDRAKQHELPEELPEIEYEAYYPEDEEVSLEYAEVVSATEPPEIYDTVVFLGRVSRSCKQCDEVKLYREFRDSRDPEAICRFCEAEQADFALFQALDDEDREEMELLEEEIIENELAYEEAMSRQEFIDQVLRELDG